MVVDPAFRLGRCARARRHTHTKYMVRVRIYDISFSNNFCISLLFFYFVFLLSDCQGFWVSRYGY